MTLQCQGTLSMCGGGMQSRSEAAAKQLPQPSRSQAIAAAKQLHIMIMIHARGAVMA